MRAHSCTVLMLPAIYIATVTLTETPSSKIPVGSLQEVAWHETRNQANSIIA